MPKMTFHAVYMLVNIKDGQVALTAPALDPDTLWREVIASKLLGTLRNNRKALMAQGWRAMLVKPTEV